jgi:hypothetical protein
MHEVIIRMAMRSCLNNSKICAMCKHWNGHIGGSSVRPKKLMMRSWEYDDAEVQLCYIQRVDKRASSHCSKWEQRDSR